MKLACSSCQKTLRVRDDLVGRRINCPDCGTSMIVPALDELEALEPYSEPDGDEEVAPNRASPGSAPKPAAADMKTCPMCGGEIKAVARKCRFCGEMLTDSAGLDSRPGHGVWRDGNRLVMSKDAQLPYTCIKTNQPADVWLRRKMYWHNSWIYVLILVSVWIYIIVALIVRQSADIQVALCRERLIRRRWTIAGAWLAVIVGLVMIIGGLANSRPGSAMGGIISIAGLILLLTGAIIGATLARVVVPVRMTKEYVWIKGAHPQYLAALPPFPGEG